MFHCNHYKYHAIRKSNPGFHLNYLKINQKFALKCYMMFGNGSNNNTKYGF